MSNIYRSSSLTLESFLRSRSVSFETIVHDHSYSAFNTAELAAVPGEYLAKPVLLSNQFNQYVMAILPSDRSLLLSALNDFKYCDYTMLTEEQVIALLDAGELGIVPSITSDSRIEILVDPELLKGDVVYLEAGDHETLLKVSKDDFDHLVQGARRVSLGGALVVRAQRIQQPYAVMYDAYTY